ncbi:MAG: beta-ketoacyl-[acyl-carrier-protein] synthase II, partial [Defluviitaleaceae bacterium]|nr:beta-ketoacyl-[acyl-carrier-protein] synthase II [Defluviitaleaceae bacterium]
MENRVVITGMGAITPIGNSSAEFIANLRAGKVGIERITKIDIENSPVKLAAEVKDYNPEDLGVPKKDIKRMDLFSQYAISATVEAMKMSGLDVEKSDSRRFGVIIGSGIGGMETFESEIIKMYEKGGFKIAPLFIPMLIGNMAAGNVAKLLGAKGICTSIVT